MATAIYYSSSTGNTEKSAGRIRKNLSKDIKLVNISNDGFENIEQYDKIIFGTNTWGYGDLQDDWERVLKDLKNIDFSGKKVAIYSTGDQESYPDTFVDSIGILADVVEAKGAKIVGYTEVEGYNFNESKGQRDGKFIGLAIDDNNQSSLTEERVKKWIETLKGEF